ncbi:MAG TPA: restriction endonuclease [Mucilaginibacter sp.]|nr:restriction endonuclease [Mucilaginibacter sp.]
MHYPLEVLNDKEFEELSKDLLDLELSISLQLFKSGRDKGIDLRYAATTENEIIVQAKRYVRSTFSQLKSELAKEKNKMDRLIKKPQRYILTTSLELNVAQSDELVKIMSPYIKTSQDVFGAERMMALISKFPTVESKYYKLWITSTTILNKILHNAALGRSEFVRKQILKKVSFYVPTVNFNVAVDKLNENHFLIISGEPGIGKTTISYLLICDLMANGYQLLHVDDKLKDAEDLLSPSPEVKQVVFFDDFFGANLSELLHPRNPESKIVGFIERIMASPNKFLVMTTRTTILNQALHRFDKFNRSKLAHLSKYELRIEAYSKLDRAKILYNHLFHSGMSTEQYDVFFQSKNYVKIIDHKNYFPRLIEFITSANQLGLVPVPDTEKFIFDCLDNPSEIWQFAYDQQLNEEEQFLLMTLFSLGGYGISSAHLQTAFESRYAYEIRNNGYTLKTDAYTVALKKLMDGFIKSERTAKTDELVFSFLNPSVGDFLLNYLRERPAEQKRILFSAAYFIQITKYFTPGIDGGLVFPEDQRGSFYPAFLLSLPALIANAEDETTGGISALYILFALFYKQRKEADVMAVFKELEFYFMDGVKLSEFKSVFSHLADIEDARNAIMENWQRIFSGAFEVAQDSSDFSSLLELMEMYDIYQSTWSAVPVFVATVGSAVNVCYGNMEVDLSSCSQEVMDARGEGFEGDALQIIEDTIAEDYAQFLHDCELSDFYDLFIRSADFNASAHLNAFIEQMSHADDDDDFRSHIRGEERSSQLDETTAIERLFER